MTMMRRSIVGSLALAAMVLAGCVVEVTVWTPIGSDASAVGSWTLNGAVPNASTCDAAGINSVEIEFSNRLDPKVIPAEFVFACESGGFNLTNILAAGTYDIQWVIRTNTETIRTMSATVIATVGGTVTFPTLDITTWTPIGTDASAVGSWTLDGAIPTVTACDAAGINSVEVQFSSGGSSLIPAQFVFACEDGGFNLPNILAAGTYDTQFFIRTDTGTVSGPSGSFTVGVGDTATFPPFDITSAPVFNPIGDDFTMDGMWTINGAAPTTASCAAAGMANVQLVIQNAGETYTEPGFIFSCASGTFDTRLLAPPISFTWGSYMTFWRALRADGTNAGMSTAIPLIVNSPTTHATLATADFVTATPVTSMTINLTYDTVVGPTMSDADCAGAGVATIFYTLTDITGGGSTIVSESPTAGIPCENAILFDDTIVTGGHRYSIYLEGANAAGAKNWNAMEATLDVAADTEEVYNIALTKVM